MIVDRKRWPGDGVTAGDAGGPPAGDGRNSYRQVDSAYRKASKTLAVGVSEQEYGVCTMENEVDMAPWMAGVKAESGSRAPC